MFLTYSLDGFINIYTFPKCKLVKLVRAIEVNEFSQKELEIVVLISNPFPMIFTYDSEKMHTLTINGDLIKSMELKSFIEKKFKRKSGHKIEIIPCIDKDFGIMNDFIYINVYINSRLYKKLVELTFWFPLFKILGLIKIGEEKKIIIVVHANKIYDMIN